MRREHPKRICTQILCFQSGTYMFREVAPSAMKFKMVAPPDGEVITVGAKRCAEVLLLPQTCELPVLAQEHGDSQGFKVDTTSLRSPLVLCSCSLPKVTPFCARCPGVLPEIAVFRILSYVFV